MAYHTSKQSTTKITPFYLTYGREAKLPIDDLSENIEQIEQRIQNLLDILPHERESAIKRIEVQQIKQKQRYDQYVRHEINFSIGDKVLYYDAAKEKQWTGKLNEKWKGPYYIHDVLQNGSYKLRNLLDGRVLRTPVNGSLLKIYHDR